MQTQEAIETAAETETPPSPTDNGSLSPQPDNSADALDELLSSYDEGTREVGSLTNQPSADVDPLDELIASSFAPAAANPELDAANGKIGELQGQLDQFQQALRTAQDQKDFTEIENGIAKQLDGIDMPPWLVRASLGELARKNPALVAAFDNRSFFKDRGLDPSVGKARLAEIDALLKMANSPGFNIQQNAQALSNLRHERDVINAALSFPRLALQAERMVVKEIREWDKHRIDRAATELKDDIGASVLRGRGRAPDEPQPDLGSMSAADLGRYRKSIGLKSSV